MNLKNAFKVTGLQWELKIGFLFITSELNQPTFQKNRKLKTRKKQCIKAIKENNIENNLTAENSDLLKVSACDVETTFRKYW